jgi:hypothetical protein
MCISNTYQTLFQPSFKISNYITRSTASLCSSVTRSYKPSRRSENAGPMVECYAGRRRCETRSSRRADLIIPIPQIRFLYIQTDMTMKTSKMIFDKRLMNMISTSRYIEIGLLFAQAEAKSLLRRLIKLLWYL